MRHQRPDSVVNVNRLTADSVCHNVSILVVLLTVREPFVKSRAVLLTTFRHLRHLHAFMVY